MRRALLPDGRVAWVNDQGQVVGISQGMTGALPGLSDARQADIMSRLPDADVVGLRGHGVVPGGEQHAGGRRVNYDQENLPEAGATYRPLSGAQVNNRGNVKSVTLATDVGGPVQIVPSIVETAKSGGQDAESIIVQLGIDFPSILTTNVDYQVTFVDVVALVEWGVGNAFFSAEVDWNQGIAFSIAASWLRVAARVGAIPAPIVAVPPVDIVLRASLGYGTATSLGVSSLPRRTIDVVPPIAPDTPSTLAAAATSALIPIPPWSMGFTLVDGGGPGGTAVVPDYTISVLENVSVPSAVYKMTSRSNVAQQVEGQFPIPRRGRFIKVTNNLGVVVTAPKLIFNLGF